jgi:predicted nucleic acid-binding protein
VNYLLDTCVLSEARRKQGHAGLKAWLRSVPEQHLFISVITLGEIQQGISKLISDHSRQHILQQWLDSRLRSRFETRTLALDEETALTWGQLSGEAMAKGETVPVVDAFLAATAIRHNLVMAIRNIDDFKRFPIRLFNPWTF